jgi:hypothetical protein
MGEPGRRGRIHDADYGIPALRSYVPAIVLGWVDLMLCLAVIASGILLHNWRAVVGGVVGALLVAWALRRLILSRRAFRGKTYAA